MTHEAAPDETAPNHVPIVVIGAGQAGLTAGYHLVRRGLKPWDDFVILDANEGPGGAWRHRWDSLTFSGAHGIHPLPGTRLDNPDPNEPSNQLVPRYYGEHEEEHDLPVLRPVRVDLVTFESGRFFLETCSGPLTCDAIINATGTWDSPHMPFHTGVDLFEGRHVHTKDYEGVENFAGQRVLVVGGGTSAIQFLEELDAAGVETVWSTRSVPRWTSKPFDEEWGRQVEADVQAHTSQGKPPPSIVAVTGLPLAPYRTWIESGLLVSRGRVVSFTAAGVVLNGPGTDGRGYPDQGEAQELINPQNVRQLPGKSAERDGCWETPIDTVLWATGFKPHVRHLRGLRLRESAGGFLIAGDGVTVVKQPGLFVAGYGASASTLGATRAGRAAAMAALAHIAQ